MRKCLTAVLAVLLSFAVPVTAAAQDLDSMSLEQLMVKEAAITVASTRKETVFNSVSNVTVIDREMIDRYNFGSVQEAIETLAGVMVWRTYFLKYLPTFRGALQDQYANKVLVMINNVPAWMAVTGENNIDRVPIEAVERIEVLRGPASVLYGSNAYVGAMNIVTKKAKKGKTEGHAVAGLGTGSGKAEGLFEATRGAAHYSRAQEDWSYAVSAGFRNESWPMFQFRDEGASTSAGYTTTGNDMWIRDYNKTRNVNLSGSYKGHSVLVNVHNSEETSLGNVITRASGMGNSHEREMQLLNYAYQFGPQLMNLKFSTTYDRQRRNFTRSESDNIRTDTQGSRIANSLSARADLPSNISLDLGVDHDLRTSYRYTVYDTMTQNVSSENELHGQSLWEGSVFGQLGWQADNLKLAAGSRYTRNKLFGGNISSRASAVYSINETNSVKAMVGQSFRSPMIFELYFIVQPVTAGGVVGNPDLEPEKTDTAEVSYLTSWGNVFGQVTGYWVEYKKTIIRTVGNFVRTGQRLTNVNYYTNAPRYNVRGIEAELRYQSPKTSGFVSFDVQDPNKGDMRGIDNRLFLSGQTVTDQPRELYSYMFVPKYTVSAGLSQQVGKFFASGVVNHYGAMSTLRTGLPVQAWADVAIGYRDGKWRHALAAKNVTRADVNIPEYVRQRAVESVPLMRDRRIEYTLGVAF